jgi:hypothetical protein
MEWISVDDALPDYDTQVIIFDAGYIEFGYLTKSSISLKSLWIGISYEYGDNAVANNVTHWLPLPQPPKE